VGQDQTRPQQGELTVDELNRNPKFIKIRTQGRANDGKPVYLDRYVSIADIKQIVEGIPDKAFDEHGHEPDKWHIIEMRDGQKYSIGCDDVALDYLMDVLCLNKSREDETVVITFTSFLENDAENIAWYEERNATEVEQNKLSAAWWAGIKAKNAAKKVAAT
jgi:hypothetical protein